MAAGVYAIINKVTGSMYVGSAVDLNQRKKSHWSSLRHHKKSPPKLQRAWNKHGGDAFEFRVLLTCKRDDTLMYEQLAIDALEPKYNTRKLAHSNLGVKWGEEVNMRKGRVQGKVYTVNGVSGGLVALCRHFGVVSYVVAKNRIKRGMDVTEAVLTPKVSRQEMGRRGAASHRRNGTHPSTRLETAFGVTASVKNLVERFGVCQRRTVYRRLGLGWGIEEALITPIGEKPRCT